MDSCHNITSAGEPGGNAHNGSSGISAFAMHADLILYYDLTILTSGR